MKKALITSLSLVFALILLGCDSKTKSKETQHIVLLPTGPVIEIDRSDSAKFSPMAFVGDDFALPNEQPEAIALKQVVLPLIDISEMRDDTYGKAYSTFSSGKKIGMDAKMLETLWKHKELIPESWKTSVDGQPIKIFFMGSTLMNAAGDKCLLYIYWHHGWYWDFAWFDQPMSHNQQCWAAVIPKK